MKASEYIKQHGDFEITEQIEKCIPHNPKTVWDLKIGDRYCYVNTLNTIRNEVWINNYNEREMRKVGRIFLTKEEAEYQIEKMKVYEELKRFAKDFTDEEWEDMTIPKFEISFEYITGKVELDSFGTSKCNQLYFESEEKAEEAIAFVGEERVKKYYLGVKKWNNVQIIDLK